MFVDASVIGRGWTHHADRTGLAWITEHDEAAFVFFYECVAGPSSGAKRDVTQVNKSIRHF